ncbi:hypothetical protein M9Y10_030037 [Tritrichomonas musculus]|uniref:Initiator binding domain-containing protein n=1 Tax=Tritrichomonas musculus TaxID=1915356 RepID=A0ABR2KNQ9_9EUKA
MNDEQIAMERIKYEIQRVSNEHKMKIAHIALLFLNHVDKYPNSVNKYGCFWYRNNLLCINAHILQKVLGIKDNSVNSNFRKNGFESKPMSRELWSNIPEKFKGIDIINKGQWHLRQSEGFTKQTTIDDVYNWKRRPRQKIIINFSENDNENDNEDINKKEINPKGTLNDSNNENQEQGEQVEQKEQEEPIGEVQEQNHKKENNDIFDVIGELNYDEIYENEERNGFFTTNENDNDNQDFEQMLYTNYLF